MVTSAAASAAAWPVIRHWCCASRGGAGGEQQHFHLALGGISRLFASLTPQAIGTSYQTIRIPFSALAASSSCKTVDALQSTFWDGYSGKIEIDSIQFE